MQGNAYSLVFMTQRLGELIKEWETKNGFTVNTLDRVKRGETVRATTAFQIARAFGCTEDEAKALADEYAASREDKESA